MQPSEIHLHKELKEFKELLKTAQTSEKQGIKNRIKEIETLLNIKKDEPNVDMVGEI
jgi:hypothetical protein